MDYIAGPKWNKSSLRPVVGEDHLGIRYVAILIADHLQSGVTSVTPRARYWSFYTWILHDFIQTQTDLSLMAFKKYLKRQEWYYILANIAEAEARGDHISQLMGSTVGLEAWNNSGAKCEYHDNYLQNAFGGYNVYRNVLKTIGTTVEGDIDNGVELDRITPVGLKLAKAFESVIKATRYYKEWRHKNEPVPKDVLLEYGSVAGLSRLNQTSSIDRPLLNELFMPANPQGILEKLRYQSLSYYRYIIDCCKGRAMDRRTWRYMMYDVFSAKGQDKGAIPPEYDEVAKGWEIYQGRQLFTYSLETMWYYLLETLSRRSYSKAEIICKVFDDLKTEGISLDSRASDVLKQIPLKYGHREDYVVHMGVDGSNVLDNIWYPLLVMLDVYDRFLERSDFIEQQNKLLETGGRDHISLKVFEGKINDGLNSKIGDLLEYILHYFILEQHKKVALDKILTSRNETYHFTEDEGKLHFLKEDHPAFNVFRVEQGLSVMADLGLVTRHDNTWKTGNYIGGGIL